MPVFRPAQAEGHRVLPATIATAATATRVISTATIGGLRPFDFALVSRPSLIGAVALRGEIGAEVRAAAFASVALAGIRSSGVTISVSGAVSRAGGSSGLAAGP